MIDLITLTGGLPRDAELRFTPQGAAVANFTLASSDNRFDQEQNQWVKTRSMYLDVTIWNEQGNKQNPTPWAEMAADLKNKRGCRCSRAQQRQVPEAAKSWDTALEAVSVQPALNNP